MPIEAAGTTLRDQLEATFDQVTDTAPETPAPEIAAPEAPAQESTPAEAKPGRTANRLRDETGKLLPGKKEPEVAAPVIPQNRPPRPSSWKKDFDEHWNTLDPKLAEYIHQREREYASGVSTYKGEAENARQLNEAIAPFLPNLQKHGLQPTQWIRNLGIAHERLALGSPQEKLHMAGRLIRDYGIDPQALFQELSNPQQIHQQAAPQVDFDSLIEQKLSQKEAQSELNRFMTEIPEKYPHFEEVKATMIGLLQAELASDYKSAYEAALRHPFHAALFESLQEQQRQQKEAEAAQRSQAVVNRARLQAVSPKSSTPAGNMATQSGKQSLRGALESAFDQVETGRV